MLYEFYNWKLHDHRTPAQIAKAIQKQEIHEMKAGALHVWEDGTKTVDIAKLHAYNTKCMLTRTLPAILGIWYAAGKLGGYLADLKNLSRY